MDRRTAVTIKRIQDAIEELIPPINRREIANKTGITHQYLCRVMRNNETFFKDGMSGVGIGEVMDIELKPSELGTDAITLPTESVRNDNIDHALLVRIAETIDNVNYHVEDIERIVDRTEKSNHNAPVEDKKESKASPSLTTIKCMPAFNKKFGDRAKELDMGNKEGWNAVNNNVRTALDNMGSSTWYDLIKVYRILEFEIKKLPEDMEFNKKAIVNDEWNR